jgi:hypothetical protein
MMIQLSAFCLMFDLNQDWLVLDTLLRISRLDYPDSLTESIRSDGHK